MALTKQPVPITFAKGLDTKTDPKQVSPGNFLSLENSVFGKGGLLQKRNGYARLTSLPDTTSNYLTTFNGNLTAIGTRLQAYSAGSASWVDRGPIQPLDLSVEPLVRSNTGQSYVDSAVASNGIVCTVYTDEIPVSGTLTPSYRYVIADSVTGQNLVAPTVIVPTTGSVDGAPRVYVLGRNFIIVFPANIAGSHHLQYIAVSTSAPSMAAAAINITSQYTPSANQAYDATVANNSLYLAFNGNDGGGAIRIIRLSSTLVQSSPVVYAGHLATSIDVSADTSSSTAIVYVNFYDSASHNGFVLAVNQNLTAVLAPTATITGIDVANLTAVSTGGVCTLLYETVNAYTYDGAIPTHYVSKETITQSGTVSSPSVVDRSIGLASKAFMVNDTMYFLALYVSAFQPTYFLIDLSGNVVAKLAYSNGPGSYYTTGLPSVIITGNVAQVPYLVRDLIQGANKAQGAPVPSGVYSQTGLNLATFTVGGVPTYSAEIASSLNLTGGLLYEYDGYQVVEQGFNVYPDNIEATSASTGGFLAAQIYFYYAVYEWTDNQGNIQRSAPSIPLEVDLSASMTATNAATVHIPTLRLTYKTANPVKITVYRWSTGQQIPYQTTSILNPLLNNTTVDSIDFVDTQADADILGNEIIYTEGGVLENIAMPAVDTLTLFDSRLWAIDSEDKNLLWFSKQVIEATPVETSDLLTIYVAPTVGAQNTGTGPMKALSAMDDKLIIFKADAIYYLNGTGPDNTGANSQYSQPTFITATVGCSNQRSIVFQPSGLMFQSDKGIWLLGRDLSTSYIGAPVESYTQGATVQSAVNVPGTNQIRFTLDTGITLMYDYYYGQWGTFVGVPAVSSTLYESLHTYINKFGQVYQETPGSYLDGSQPVLLQFTTGWMNLAGLQGYERAYFFYMLAEYASPHKLSVSIAYNYNPSPAQVSIISPTNATPAWGGGNLWGSEPVWGGQPSLEQWRVFFREQKVQSFQISIQEMFDSTVGQSAGAGLSISGLNLVVGIKKGYRTIGSSRSVG